MLKQFIIVTAALILAVTSGALAERDRPKPSRERLEKRRTLEKPDALPRRERLSRRKESTRRHKKFKLTEKQENELMAALKKNRPELYKRLTRLRKRNKWAYRKSLRRAWPMYEKWKDLPKELRKNASQRHKARLHIWKLVRKIRRARDKNEKTKLVKQLRKTIAEQFEIELNIQEERLARLEEQIKRVRAELKEQAKHKKHIINERIDRLLEAEPKPRPLRKKPNTADDDDDEKPDKPERPVRPERFRPRRFKPRPAPPLEPEE